jgi:hypothetical protein
VRGLVHFPVFNSAAVWSALGCTPAVKNETRGIDFHKAMFGAGKIAGHCNHDRAEPSTLVGMAPSGAGYLHFGRTNWIFTNKIKERMLEAKRNAPEGRF